jgi:hypothetical protein
MISPQNRDLFKKLQTQALNLMKTSGFPIFDEVLFEIDEQLPIMGYTADRFGKTLVVVSSWSLKTDMPLGLLIHELSHVYRTQTFHPSHNYSLQNQAIGEVFKNLPLPPLREESIRNIINNIQDLYADDISFDVYFKKHHRDNLNEFFLGWIQSPTPDSWKNAEYLLSAAFAKANLERHEVPDPGKRIDLAVRQFLSQIDIRQAEKFDYYKNLMVNLPEKISEDEFSLLLTRLLRDFIDLAKPDIEK